MGLFDRKPGGFMDKANEWMTPERALAFSAIGQGFSQMGSGQPVDLSNAHQALAQRQQRSQQQRTLEASGLMEKFNPEQRAILAQMEPSAAQKIIAGVMFAKPEGPRAGINVGGRVIDPVTGRVIYEGPQETKKPIEVNGQLVDPDTYKVVGDFRNPPPPPGAPTTKQIKREDGSEIVVEWLPDANDTVNGGEWVPIDAPLGGATVGVGPTSGAKLTEKQAQMTLFSTMQNETAPVLNQIEEQYDPANISDAAARSTPLAGNFFQTQEGQVYQASSAVWSEGALRLATGAAATQPEIERVQATYFAKPGDTPTTVQFKSQLRDMYNRSIQAALGRGVPEGELQLPMDFFKEAKDQIGGSGLDFTEELGGKPDNGLSDDDNKYLDAN